MESMLKGGGKRIHVLLRSAKLNTLTGLQVLFLLWLCGRLL